MKGVLVCKTIPFVQTTAIVTGILTMTCIAVERYQGIVHPLKIKRQCTPQRAYRMLGVVWIAAMTVGSPMLFVQQLEVKYDFLYEHQHVCCQERWSSSAHRKQYATFILVFLFVLPLGAMLLIYTRIGITLWICKQVGDSSVLNTMNHREVSKISRKKRRAIKMMVTIVVLFTVCWAPFHTVHMLFEYSYLGKKYDEITVNIIIAVTQAIGRSGHRVDVNDKSKVCFSKTPGQEEDIFVMPSIHIVDQVASARSNTQASLSVLEERISAEDSTIHARCIRD
ncbi:pyroglutamylated RF-amide peptide receptor isoform X3 [Triplophysa rosa]|uniref:pyroglutamylated RF-amide peptide receptor isoform X3 n=1 Tax=Triplophysa rosa TaxID=992332 RepID=UPI00254618C2|nr:pyroglutamylated RF-amide peptide receptor isoform X3 [Triplophysa rosa]